MKKTHSFTIPTPGVGLINHSNTHAYMIGNPFIDGRLFPHVLCLYVSVCSGCQEAPLCLKYRERTFLMGDLNFIWHNKGLKILVFLKGDSVEYMKIKGVRESASLYKIQNIFEW